MKDKHLSIASYIRVLTAGAVKPKGTFGAMSELLFMSLCNDDNLDFSYENSKGQTIIYNEDNYGKIHRGGYAVPNEIVKMAERKSRGALLQYFCNIVSSDIDGRKKKVVVLALRDIILNDPKITDDTYIGIDPAFTKLELRSIRSFTLSSFLLDVFLFALAKTDNTIRKDFIKSINGPAYLEQFNDRIDEIELLKDQPKVNASKKEDDSKKQIVQKNPPLRPQKKESKYVEALLNAYSDAEDGTTISLKILDDPKYSKYKRHLENERRNFYAAESLREGTKDLFPEGEVDEFELLKDDIYAGIIYVYNDEHKNYLVRCNHVMTAAGQVQVQSTKTFIDNHWLGTIQKQGVCHFLVNEDKLNGWAGLYE